jgi:hypothetical protein
VIPQEWEEKARAAARILAVILAFVCGVAAHRACITP